MKVHTKALASASLLSLLAAAPAFAQAPETQSQTNPAPAENAAAAQAGATNNAGPGNAPTNAANGGGVEEIVVTAQFREQNLQDTPIAITAVSSAMLEARSQTNISEVANQAPSVTLRQPGAAFGPSLGANIRGIGQFDFNPALEPGVGLYVDDVYFATLTGSILDLLDLDRVEILRGPQGTLAGRNSIGGAVKLYSKRPTGSNSGFVQGTYGSRDRIDLRAAADFKLTDTLFARLSGVSKKQDGYVKRLDFGCVNPPGSALNPGGVVVNPAFPAQAAIPSTRPAGECTVARDGEVNYQAVRGQLRFKPNDKLDINIIGDYTNDDRNVAGAVLLDRSVGGVRVSPAFNGAAGPRPADIDPFTPNGPAGTVNPNNIPLDTRFLCGRYCNYASFSSPADGTSASYSQNGRSKFEGWGVSGQIEYRLSDDVQLVSITAYRKYTANFTNDDDLTPLAHSLGGGPLTFHSFSQELRLNGSLLDDKIEYTLGGYYSDQKSVYSSTQVLRYAGLPAFFQSDPVNADTKAVFLHVQWKPVDRLTLIGGLRYTDDHKDYTFTRVPPSGNGPLPVLGALNGLTGVFDGPQSTRFDYRANIQYEITDAISVYGQISTGYKGGGINPRPFYPQQVLSFGPETLTAYEVGFKSDLFDRKMRLNIAAFLSKYKDIQLSLSNCTAQAGAGFGIPCALPFNAGDADIKGLEVETSIRPVRGMIIDGAFSYLDFDYKKIAPNTGITSGMVSTYTPKWKWSIGAQYEIGMGDAGSLTPRIDASYQSHVFTNAVNRESNRIAGYTLANARITWANGDKDLEISGEVTNLFDKYYLNSIFDLTAAGAGIASGQPGRPREWAVTVKKKF